MSEPTVDPDAAPVRPPAAVVPEGVTFEEARAAIALVTQMALLPPRDAYLLTRPGTFVRSDRPEDRLDLAAVAAERETLLDGIANGLGLDGLVPKMSIRRGGVQYPPADWLDGTRIVQTGGWCAPGEDVRGWPIADPTESVEREPVPPCDGVNHRWERFSTGACHECGHSQPGRRVLECEACPATLNENADGLPAGHFDRLWKAAT